MNTNRFVIDFCPYEHGIVDIITQLLLQTVTGEVKTIKPVPVQVSREQKRQQHKRVRIPVNQSAVLEEGMIERMVHAENIPKIMERLDVPILTGEALHTQLQNMMVVSAVHAMHSVPNSFPDYMLVRQVAGIAEERLRNKARSEQDALEAARQEQNSERKVRQRGIRAELYKLNVYFGPSGMFKSHVDTPRSDDQIGSLVVALPVAFQGTYQTSNEGTPGLPVALGGALAVRQQGQEVLHDWSATISNSPCIQWAAFYSDCEHEVLEVTNGHRLTLTYNLFVSADTGLLNAAALRLSSHRLPLYGQIRGLLERACFFIDSGYLGVYLLHSYPHTNDKLHRFVPNMLKGADMATYEAFAALGLACVLSPTNSGSAFETLQSLDMQHKLMATHDLAEYIRPKPLASLLSAVHITPDYNESDNDSEDVGTEEDFDDRDPHDPGEQYDRNGAVLGEKGLEIRKGKQAWRKVVWLNEAKHQELSKVYMVYGNQAEMKVSYSSVALVVKIPSWQERSGRVQSAADLSKSSNREKYSTRVASAFQR